MPFSCQDPEPNLSSYWGILSDFLLPPQRPRELFKRQPSHQHSCSWKVEEGGEEGKPLPVKELP